MWSQLSRPFANCLPVSKQVVFRSYFYENVFPQLVHSHASRSRFHMTGSAPALLCNRGTSKLWHPEFKFCRYKLATFTYLYFRCKNSLKFFSWDVRFWDQFIVCRITTKQFFGSNFDHDHNDQVNSRQVWYIFTRLKSLCQRKSTNHKKWSYDSVEDIDPFNICHTDFYFVLYE